MLHTISKILQDDLLQYCIDTISLQQEASLLLYQNGVYLAISESATGKRLDVLTTTKKIYVLVEDAMARGIENKLLKNIVNINYTDFVKLTIQHHKMISW